MKKYKSAEEYIKGDKIKLLGYNITIAEIYRGNIELNVDGKKKTVFVADDEATVILKNDNDKKELSFKVFKKLINEKNAKLKEKENKKSERKKKKEIFDKKTSGKEYRVGEGDLSKMKSTDTFMYKGEKYVVDNIREMDGIKIFEIVVIRNPKKTYQYNKENFSNKVPKSKLINIWKSTKVEIL